MHDIIVPCSLGHEVESGDDADRRSAFGGRITTALDRRFASPARSHRRRMIRRGATYGPHLPEDAPEDGVERGIAAFVICASLIRQYEFAQNVWVNDRNFHELGNERDPIIGTHDGTLEFKIPKRPIRKKITGLPAFTTVKGGAYFFLPGIKALRHLATLDDVR